MGVVVGVVEVGVEVVVPWLVGEEETLVDDGVVDLVAEGVVVGDGVVVLPDELLVLVVEGTRGEEEGGEEEGGEREEEVLGEVVLLAEAVLGVGEEVVPDVTCDAVVDGAADVACADVAGADPVAGALDDMMVKVGYQRLEIKKGEY
jgi:hypothetical protein